MMRPVTLRTCAIRILLLPLACSVGLSAGCYSSAAPSTIGASGGGSDRSAVLGAPADSSQLGCDADGNVDQLANQVFTLINLERSKIGIAPLVRNDELNQAAEDYSCTMAAEDFFDHIHPDTGEGPADRAAEAGYEFFSIGENLAAGQSTPAEAVEAWMNSTGHRNNLLSPEWKETGIGVRRGGSYRIYWTQEFGKPADFPRSVHSDASLTTGSSMSGTLTTRG